MAQLGTHLINGGHRMEADVVDGQCPGHVELRGEAVLLGRNPGHLGECPEHRRAGGLEDLDVEDLGVLDHVDGGSERDETVGGSWRRSINEAHLRGRCRDRCAPSAEQAHYDRCSSSPSIHASADRRAAVASSRTTSPTAPPTG